MKDRMIEFEVFRYRPDTDSKPSWQTYTVPCREEWVVLDALNYIKDHLDGSLSYRWSCHMAVCGSCGMMVNGKPTLSCKAFVRDYPGPIRVGPLDNLEVTRDLVVDQSRLMNALPAVKSWLVPAAPPPADAEYKQSPAQLERFRHLSMCINCMLCYAACPQVALNPHYLGPGALALAQRYNLDSRDGGRHQRADTVASEDGVWECTFIGECSEVCPKHVDPAGAIQQLKLASSIDWFTGLLGKAEKS
jgi:fumarate reductase iron-sulfur subunit